MAARLRLLLPGAAVYGLSTYGFYAYFRPPPADLTESESKGCHDRSTTSRIYNGVAAEYDSSMAWEEWMTGITGMRKAMMAHASGDVLEVSIGTGRNLEFYTDKVRRLLGVDISPAMLEVARGKLPAVAAAGGIPQDRVQLQAADAVAGVDGGRWRGRFDCVVDTFGLCSTDDPVGLLRAMGRACKPGGRILLLEHGRSREWAWLSRYLDRNAPRHARKWGCWYNRDIRALVEQAGLVVEEVEERHWGTTYRIVARPPP